METLTCRGVETCDLEKICTLPQNAEELFFMFPKAQYPLTISQLESAIHNRSDSTVFLLDGEVVGFANFYEVKENEYCSIGNLIVNSNCRNRGIGEFIVKTMEAIGIEKYHVIEFHISCFNTNTRGLLLYSKLGYLPYGIEKWVNVQNELFGLIKLKREV